LKKIIYKATAVSPANIAFIKFWGKKDPEINIPFNDSISMNLSRCLTTTTVEFNSSYLLDRIVVGGKEVSEAKKERVVKILDQVRKRSNLKLKAKVISKNNFPEGAGIASSASAFSALALAASSTGKLSLSLKELSILSRHGSGSACRSVVDGFAQWQVGDSDTTSYAVQIAAPDFWELRDIVCVVSKEEKKVSSTEGHGLATSSPYFKTRLKILPEKISKLKEAFFRKDFRTFGQIVEEEAVDLHMMAMTSSPPIFYWNEGTMEIIQAVQTWRENGLLVYFTMDAGPNVHLICLKKNVAQVSKEIKKSKNVLFTIINKPCEGSCLSKEHLF